MCEKFDLSENFRLKTIPIHIMQFFLDTKPYISFKILLGQYKLSDKLKREIGWKNWFLFKSIAVSNSTETDILKVFVGKKNPI